MRILMVIVLVLAGAGFTAWQYKDRIQGFIDTRINPPASAEHPAEKPDVLYSWVDKDGVTHYEQDAGKGSRVSFDGARITRMEPVSDEELARLEAAEAARAEEEKRKGSEMLHKMRDDMQRQQRAMSGDL